MDVGLFIWQWQQEQETDTTVWENDLLIGKKSAPILITVACNPYCGPCSKEHKQLDRLLQRAGDKIKLQIRLTFNTEDAGDRRTIATRAILQRACAVASNVELRQMLTDWFEWMDYDKWINKWRVDHTLDVEASMKLHSQWMDENRISYTPTTFINGRKMPSKYSIHDFDVLIAPLAEIFEKDAA
jgi:protein-disulfide isomerase